MAFWNKAPAPIPTEKATPNPTKEQIKNKADQLVADATFLDTLTILSEAEKISLIYDARESLLTEISKYINR